MALRIWTLCNLVRLPRSYFRKAAVKEGVRGFHLLESVTQSSQRAWSVGRSAPRAVAARGGADEGSHRLQNQGFGSHLVRQFNSQEKLWEQ
jgi:hypothetical protein